MAMNPTFHQKNDYENMAFDVEYLKYQYKNNKSSEVVKIKSHKYEYKENEYDDVIEVEQPTNKAPQNERKTQRCRVSLNKNLLVVNTVRKQIFKILLYRVTWGKAINPFFHR